VKHQLVIPLLICVAWLATAKSSLSNPTNDYPSRTGNWQAGEIAARLEGIMDTSAQAAANPKVSNVRMTTCRVQVLDAQTEDSVFLYQEQALAQKLAQPYRQRFLQISQSSLSQSVRSLSFKPANPTAWVNFCNAPPEKRTIKVTDLGNPVCSVFLKQSGDDFIGFTPVNGCPANVRGAVRITNRIVLHKTGMETWDRGYDANGKQVWGAKTESYQFRRITQSPETQK
jgi:hypothetical protein